METYTFKNTKTGETKPSIEALSEVLAIEFFETNYYNLGSDWKTVRILTAVSICDSNCIFKAELISRKKDFVTLLVDGTIIRKKVKKDYKGGEYVLAMGSYSMCPVFRL